MGPLPSVKLGVSFQIVQTAKARITGVTTVRLLLAMGEEVAFQVVMPSEISIAVRAFVSLAGGRPGTVSTAIPRLR